MVLYVTNHYSTGFLKKIFNCPVYLGNKELLLYSKWQIMFPIVDLYVHGDTIEKAWWGPVAGFSLEKVFSPLRINALLNWKKDGDINPIEISPCLSNFLLCLSSTQSISYRFLFGFAWLNIGLKLRHNSPISFQVVLLWRSKCQMIEDSPKCILICSTFCR
jgi:hypothetical protein